MTLAASTSAAGLLVISEVYTDGWNAYVDGQKEDILRTDHALRGVPIAAGDHTVELKYEPQSLQTGMMISGGTAIVVTGIWAWSLVDWRRRGAAGSASGKKNGTNGKQSAKTPE
jgi:uncharacterized membrane protein YfhO